MAIEPPTHGIVFEPLPSTAGGPATDFGLGHVIPILKARPDEWARVLSGEPKQPRLQHMAHTINKGKNPWFKTDFAASVRKQPDGKFALYMRYVGDEEFKASE
jgi:hypothetical protein